MRLCRTQASVLAPGQKESGVCRCVVEERGTEGDWAVCCNSGKEESGKAEGEENHTLTLRRDKKTQRPAQSQASKCSE